MGLVSDFFTTDDKCLVIWMCSGLMIRKNYVHPVVAVPLKDSSAVLIIEPDGVESPDNAVLYKADGTEYKRIKFPSNVSDGICFGDAYYIGDELTLFFMCKHAYYGCVCDSSGNITRVFESR
jgi:hypothetical protein